MLIGHQKQWQFLKNSTELGKLPHALLFSGQEKLGKKTLAIEFVKWLFNEDIEKKPHPDFIFIRPDSEPPAALFPKPTHPKKEIQISQIRELILKLSLKPSLAPFKVGIIDQAHLMNQEAQNCFLKTLEEPKGKTLLILITEFPDLLFPTILSRVQKIKFHLVKRGEIKNYLQTQGISESKVEEILELSMGRPGIAIDFISNSKKLEERKQKIKEFLKILNSTLVFRFQYVKELSREGDLRETLNIWLNFFHSLLLSLKPDVKSSFPDYSLTKLKKILKQIQDTIYLISTTNVNPRLALEILMLEL